MPRSTVIAAFDAKPHDPQTLLHPEDGPRRDAGHPPHEPVVAALRRATRDRHRDIEAQLQLDGRFTRRRYAAVVHGFAEFLAAWEPRLDAALPVRLRPWFAGRTRSAQARRTMRASRRIS